jgi:hypothetical protein
VPAQRNTTYTNYIYPVSGSAVEPVTAGGNA